MSWVEDQIKQREFNDEGIFQESLAGLSDAVLGTDSKYVFMKPDESSKEAIRRIMNYYRIPERRLPKSLTDVQAQIDYLLKPDGIMTREVELRDNWYITSVFPLLVRRKDKNEWTALMPVYPMGYSFIDSQTGKKTRVNQKNEALFERQATTFYRPLPLKRIGIPELSHFVLNNLDKWDIAMLFALEAVIAGIGLILPYINRMMTGTVIATRNIQLFTGIAICLVCFNISRVLFSAHESLINARISTKLSTAVESATIMRVLSLPTDFFSNNSSGELASRIGLVQSICNSITKTILSTGLTSLFALIYIPQLFMFAKTLAVPAIIVILLISLVVIVSSLTRLTYVREQVELNAQESGMSYALIRGVQKIKLAGAEKRSFGNWAKLFEKLLRVQYNLPWFVRQSSAITAAISLMGGVVIYACALKSNIGASNFYVFNSIYGMVMGAFLSMAGIAETIAAIKPQIELIKPFLDAEPEINENKIPVQKLGGDIELENVSFRYQPEGPDILKDISLKIKPGEYLAIVGASGCGKSTLMRIMLGFLKPGKGAVYYDGKNIESIDIRSLRRRIGTVLQDGKLLRGTIYSNITLTAPYLSVDEAMQAAEIAGIADDIKEMPMGIMTMVTDGTGSVSGGQKQRILIARAIAPKPDLLFFDEATSALDNITQKKVCDALDALNCTRVVIAHRLSTIRHCDRIIVMNKGRIYEEGTYEELMEKKDMFYDLVKRQTGN